MRGRLTQPREKDTADAFLADFNDEELMALLRFLLKNVEKIERADRGARVLLNCAVNEWPIDHLRRYFPLKTIGRLLHLILFARVVKTADYYRIIGASNRIKAIVASGVLAGNQFLPSTPAFQEIPPPELSRFIFPHGMEIANSAFSEKVDVTKHAWDRFCERYIKAWFSIKGAPTGQRYYIEALRSCFSRALRVELPEGVVSERLDNNRRWPVLYLLDPTTKLRFVVTNNLHRKATLITVDPAQ